MQVKEDENKKESESVGRWEKRRVREEEEEEKGVLQADHVLFSSAVSFRFKLSSKKI